MWVNPAVGRITSGFGMRTSPTDGVYRLHSGTDIGAPSGAPIWAATAGTVTFSGFQTGGGNMVKIAHPGGIETWYLHMTARHVATGAHVAAGQQIGTIGSTGNSTGPHLHIETRLGGPQDPIPFFAARGVNLGVGTPPAPNPTPTPDPEPAPTVQEDDMRGLIEALYRRYLGREGAARELDDWTISAATGARTGAQVVDTFLSGRAESATVIAAYQEFLGRAPGESEIASWLQSQPSIRQVRTGIAGSPEAG